MREKLICFGLVQSNCSCVRACWPWFRQRELSPHQTTLTWATSLMSALVGALVLQTSLLAYKRSQPEREQGLQECKAASARVSFYPSCTESGSRRSPTSTMKTRVACCHYWRAMRSLSYSSRMVASFLQSPSRMIALLILLACGGCKDSPDTRCQEAIENASRILSKQVGAPDSSDGKGREIRIALQAMFSDTAGGIKDCQEELRAEPAKTASRLKCLTKANEFLELFACFETPTAKLISLDIESSQDLVAVGSTQDVFVMILGSLDSKLRLDWEADCGTLVAAEGMPRVVETRGPIPLHLARASYRAPDRVSTCRLRARWPNGSQEVSLELQVVPPSEIADKPGSFGEVDNRPLPDPLAEDP